MKPDNRKRPRTVERQSKEPEWMDQWSRFQDDEKALFEEWIWPNKFDNFRGKTVLDCGSGGGQHMAFSAPYAKRVIGVDLNTAKIAGERNSSHPHCEVIEGDIANISFKEKFDIVYCIGVIHHTIDPDATFRNLVKFCKRGGRLIVWCYSLEGNWFVKWMIKPVKRYLFSKWKRSSLYHLASIMTVMQYLGAYTFMRLIIFKWLPYYEYFMNFRRLSFNRNKLNTFDKLNAPTTHFISKDQITSWFNSDMFSNVQMSSWRNVSWRTSGTLESNVE